MRDPSCAASGGRREQTVELAKAGLATGIAGLFIEANPNPDKTRCDGPSALPLDKLEPFLAQMKALDDLIKALRTSIFDKRDSLTLYSKAIFGWLYMPSAYQYGSAAANDGFCRLNACAHKTD